MKLVGSDLVRENLSDNYLNMLLNNCTFLCFPFEEYMFL